MRETTAAQCPIHPMETQPCPVCLATMDNSMASYNAGYAAGYRAAQAAMPPREPTPKMIDAATAMHVEMVVHCRKGPDYPDIWRAMHDVWAQEQTSGAASAVTDGPAADPIADLCMQIRAFLADAPKEMPHEGYRYGELLSFAADALERLARERDVLSDTLADTRLRAERAEAERDALREVVRAADAIVADVRPTRLHDMTANEVAYGRARAKVKGTI